MKEKKPCILVVAPYGFNDRLANFAEFTVSRLLAKRGWRVIGITRRENGEPRKHAVHGIAVHRYKSALFGAIGALFLFVLERPDIVHVHMLRNNRVGAASAILAKAFRVPLVFSEAGLLHDHYLVADRDDPLGKPIIYGNAQKTLDLRRLHNYFFHWPLTHADAVVFYSKHNVPIAQKLGIRNVRYIPLIVDDARWETVSASGGIVEQLPKAPYGLFIGQMKERKGWDVLLRAIPSVSRRVLPAFVFVSSSSRSEPASFGALADPLGIRDRVVFLGRIRSNGDLRAVFERSALVVVPSRYEGFGLVPLDAFESGKPVVASRVEAMTDFLENGRNSRLVPPKDPEALARAITEVAADAALQAKLVEGGRETLARMKNRTAAEEWVNFYEKLLRS